MRHWCINFKNGRFNVYDETRLVWILKTCWWKSMRKNLYKSSFHDYWTFRKFPVNFTKFSSRNSRENAWPLQILWQASSENPYRRPTKQRLVASLTFSENYDKHDNGLLDTIVTSDETWVRCVLIVRWTGDLQNGDVCILPKTELNNFVFSRQFTSIHGQSYPIPLGWFWMGDFRSSSIQPRSSAKWPHFSNDEDLVCNANHR